MTEEELEHFGILGMHWGHRKGKTKKLTKDQIRYQNMMAQHPHTVKAGKIVVGAIVLNSAAITLARLYKIHRTNQIIKKYGGY